MARTYGKAQDLIDFTRASSGTALRRVKYGAELVTNGAFDSGLTGWNNSPSIPMDTFELSSGRLHIVNTAGTAQAAYTDDSISLIAGRVYTFSADLEKVGGTDNWDIDIRNAAQSTVRYFLTNTATTETLVVHFVATTTENVVIQITARNTFEGYIDNVSVKEVTFDTSDGDLILFNHPNNIPRIEYDANGNVLGLLVEESRTNLITYSESFDNSSYWTLLFSTLESGYSAPDGSNNAYLLTASSSSYYIYRSGAHVGLTTISMFMKAGTSNIGGLYSTGGISCLARFNLNTGTVDFTQDCTATITAVGNGWYRCSATYTNTSTGNMGFFMPNTTAGDSVYIFGFQSEAGAFPTSYVPSNSGSTTTRSADVASLSTSAFGYRQDEGSVVVDFNSRTDLPDGASAIAFSNGTSSDRWTIRPAYARSWVGGVSNNIVGYDDVGETFSKIAFAIDSSSNVASKDGGAVSEVTVTNVPSGINILYVGTRFDGAAYFLNGHIKSVKYYPRRLTNDQLVEVTS